MFRNDDWVQMHPAWYGAAGAVGALLGSLIWRSIFGPLDGTLLMAFWMASLLGWPITVAIVAGVLAKLLELNENTVIRAAGLAASVGACFLFKIQPSLWTGGLALVIGAVMYVHAARALDDEQELKNL